MRCALTTCQYGQVSNMSKTGCRVVSKKPIALPPGATVNLEIKSACMEVTVTARVKGGLAVACRGMLRVLPGAAPAPLDWHRRSAQQSLRSVRRGRATVGPATARWSEGSPPVS